MINPAKDSAPMEPALIPLPASCTRSAAPGCRLGPDTCLVAGWGTRPEAETLASQLARTFGRAPAVLDEGAVGPLRGDLAPPAVPFSNALLAAIGPPGDGQPDAP